ncbi:MAG: GTP cyclohydrolase I FolE [Nakamurella sp.]
MFIDTMLNDAQMLDDSGAHSTGLAGSVERSAADRARAAGSVTPFRRRIRPSLPNGATIDREAAQRAVADLLSALGRDPSGPHLLDTPRRVADALIEMTTSEDFDFTTFPNDENYDDMVVEIGIPIHSLCEHHMLPFFGVAHIAYIPGDRILGISKLARVARMFAHDLQVQERLTAQIANWLDDALHPRGVGVVIEAEHLCQSLRGVKAPGAKTVTSALRGTMRTDSRTREEFLSLTRGSGR